MSFRVGVVLTHTCTFRPTKMLKHFVEVVNLIVISVNELVLFPSKPCRSSQVDLVFNSAFSFLLCFGSVNKDMVESVVLFFFSIVEVRIN